MIGSSQVVRELKKEGYKISHSYLAYLLREDIICLPAKGPGGVYLWESNNVEELIDELRQRGRGPKV